jgi:ABC-2 type transport system permease protein
MINKNFKKTIILMFALIILPLIFCFVFFDEIIKNIVFFGPILIILTVSIYIWILLGGYGSFRTTYSYMKRSFFVFISYKLQLIFIFINILIVLIIFYTVGKPLVNLMMSSMSGALLNYGGYDALTYVVVGIITWPLILSGYHVSSQGIKQEQYAGMFEVLIPTKYGVKVLPFSYLVRGLIFSFITSLATFSVFIFLLKIELKISNPQVLIGLFSIIFLSTITMWGVGLIFGGLTILYKQLGPAPGIFMKILLFFSGVYVPIEILPTYIKPISYALPITYSFKSIRSAMINGSTIVSYWPELIVLLIYCFGVIGIGYLIFNFCLNKARKKGTTSNY